MVGRNSSSLLSVVGLEVYLDAEVFFDARLC